MGLDAIIITTKQTTQHNLRKEEFSRVIFEKQVFNLQVRKDFETLFLTRKEITVLRNI